MYLTFFPLFFTLGDVNAKLQAKCSVVAAMNPQNCLKPIEKSNMTIEQSLLSRFDLVFELEDPGEIEFDMKVMQLIMTLGKEEEKATVWSNERLKKHIIIAKKIPTRMTKEAEKVIENYFWICERNDQIELCRRTRRLLTSLQRLAKCHAKLMLRREAVIPDALSAIMIMEQTWTFGHLISRKNNVTLAVPLYMSNQMMTDIMNKLQLGDLWEEYLGSKFKNSSNPRQSQSNSIDQIKMTQPENIDLDMVFSDQIDDDENDVDIKEDTNRCNLKANTKQFTLSDISSLIDSKENIELSNKVNLESSKHQISDSQQKLLRNLDSLHHAMFGHQESQVEEPIQNFSTPQNNPTVVPRQSNCQTPKTGQISSIESKLKKFEYESQSTSQSQKIPETLTPVENEKMNIDDDEVDFHLWSPLVMDSTNPAVETNDKNDVDIGDFDLWGGFD